MVTEAEGEGAVRLARSALRVGIPLPSGRDVAAEFRSAELPPIFEEPRGVFVTLRRTGSGALRGCVGFPSPVYPLRSAIPRAAVAAAVEDPRFPPVRLEELDAVQIDVSILTVPQVIAADSPDELAARVEVGRHGLIVGRAGASGILLPQVAEEYGWSAIEFLEATCEKAGLAPDDWRRPGTTVRTFAAEVFEESSPGGPVHRVPLGGSG